MADAADLDAQAVRRCPPSQVENQPDAPVGEAGAAPGEDRATAARRAHDELDPPCLPRAGRAACENEHQAMRSGGAGEDAQARAVPMLPMSRRRGSGRGRLCRRSRGCRRACRSGWRFHFVTLFRFGERRSGDEVEGPRAGVVDTRRAFVAQEGDALAGFDPTRAPRPRGASTLSLRPSRSPARLRQARICPRCVAMRMRLRPAPSAATPRCGPARRARPARPRPPHSRGTAARSPPARSRTMR